MCTKQRFSTWSRRASATFFILLLALSVTSAECKERSREPLRATLVGYAVLPAETWSEGPACGAFDNEGYRLDKPRFHTQPVQGISSMQPGKASDLFWALSDNGFGGKANSPDYLLRIYELRLRPKTADSPAGGKVEVIRYIPLRDPGRKVPFLLVNETTPDRLLTGGDFDPESLAFAPDGTIWIGDEFGPFLLHFSADGRLLEPPFEISISSGDPPSASSRVRSPHHPALMARGVQPGEAGVANLETSGGFEGLAIDPKGERLFAMLEKRVKGGPKGLLRIYEFDLSKRAYNGKVHFYRLESPAHLTGELIAVDRDRFLVIERDNLGGEEAAFKRIYGIDLGRSKGNNTEVKKEALVDLLHVNDPDSLAGPDSVLLFPFQCIESVVLLDEKTLLVVNDNNFDTRGARGPDRLNDNEFIWLRLRGPVSEAVFD